MRFLILNTDYPKFLQSLYAQHRGLENQTYDEQMRVRNDSLFGSADFYSSNLRKLGHEAWDIHADNQFLQRAWLREHGLPIEGLPPAAARRRDPVQHARELLDRTPLRHLKPLLRPLAGTFQKQPAWIRETLAAQIKYYKPDVLWNQVIGWVSSGFLKEMKSYVRVVVGQHAATRLPEAEDFSCYDLAVSSFAPTVEYLRQKGLRTHLNRLGFEPSVLARLAASEQRHELSFIGSFMPVHTSRTELLDALCGQFPQLNIWGPDVDHLPPMSNVRTHYVGPAWGRSMFQILRDSKITLNHHGNVPPYANNMRLYEATGVGTLLITDWKENLHELFEPGKEVAAYRTPAECAELIRHFLEHHVEREAIAHAGQQRTLREHTYYHRMQEFVDIVRQYV